MADPENDEGSPVTSYMATAFPGSESCSTGGLSCTIGGLTNGTTYSVTVVAVNGAGTSATFTSISGTPEPTVPDAPGTPTLTSLNKSLAVSWSPPDTNGGSAITSYVASASSSSGTSTCSTTGALSCTISGLANGTTYSVTVIAVNVVGQSAASLPVTGIPYTVPGAPQSVKVKSENAALSVSWLAPASDGGNPISTYTVYAYVAPTTFTCTTSGTMCTVTGLANGTKYLVNVVANNLAGHSAQSANSHGTPKPTAPSARQSVTATGASGAITVAWQAPANDGGSPVTSYTATATFGKTVSTCSTSTLTCQITSIKSGKTYQVTVTATNAVGTSPTSPAVPVAVLTVPGAPRVWPLCRGTAR